MEEKKPRIPTREEFHREFAGILTNDDFCTCRPNTKRIKKLQYINAEIKYRNELSKTNTSYY